MFVEHHCSNCGRLTHRLRLTTYPDGRKLCENCNYPDVLGIEWSRAYRCYFCDLWVDKGDLTSASVEPNNKQGLLCPPCYNWFSDHCDDHCYS